MDQSDDYELPSESEKLSHRFILDSLRHRMLREKPTEVTLPTEPSKCGTVAPAATPDESTPNQLGEYQQLELPLEKSYYRVSEVSEIIGVKPHVLRFWQNEFPNVRPHKSGNGHWVYSRQDLNALHYIRHLLYIEKYSVKGAKQLLKERRKQKKSSPGVAANHDKTLKEMTRGLKELIQLARNTPTY